MLARIKRSFLRHPWRWMLGGAVGFIAFSVINVKATSHSSFCKSCHLMKSYHATWQDDAHKKVECIKCHIAPGLGNTIHAKMDGFGQLVNEVLGRSATRPAAHVSDLACTRAGCHIEGELDANDEARRERTGRPYLFSHEKHLGTEHLGIKIHCTTCHSYVRGEVHFEINTNACLSCHLLESGGDGATLHASGTAGRPAWRDGSRQEGLLAAQVPAGLPQASGECHTCHEPPPEPIRYNGVTIDHSEYLEYGAACGSCHQGVTAKPSAVEDSRCLSCHGFGMERALPVAELHKVHIEGKHKVQCFNCHGLIVHGSQVQGASLAELECGACHDGSHGLQRMAYQHHEASEPSLSHATVSPMFLAHVACTSCHVEPDASRTSPLSGATVARASPEACDTCHRSGLGERTVSLWQRSTRELYESVEQIMPPASRRSAATPEAARLLDEAERVLELVRMDGSWGVHNPRYTQELLEEARSKVLMARALMNGNGSHATEGAQ